jgi:hypothetical protein
MDAAEPGRLERLTAASLPELCRRVCAYAGVAPASGERYLVRTGRSDPGAVALLLAEALALPREGPRVLESDEDAATLNPGEVAVVAGTGTPCPAGANLLEVAVLLDVPDPLELELERRDAAGRLLGVTWVVLAAEAPVSELPLTAAVLRRDY